MRVYHYLKVCWAIENLKQRRLKLAKIDDVNDPYERACVRSDHPLTQQVLDDWNLGVAKNYGVLCFSRSWNNILMWSHYGDRHKGICLGFDVPDTLVSDVRYSSNIGVIGDLIGGAETDMTGMADQLSYGKYIGWSYEEEVRVYGLRQVEEGGKYFTPFGEGLKLAVVITGARFSDSESKTLIEDALKGYSGEVKIITTRRSTERFEIIVDEDRLR
jgi:hypothetical protein